MKQITCAALFMALVLSAAPTHAQVAVDRSGRDISALPSVNAVLTTNNPQTSLTAHCPEPVGCVSIQWSYTFPNSDWPVQVGTHYCGTSGPCIDPYVSHLTYLRSKAAYFCLIGNVLRGATADIVFPNGLARVSIQAVIVNRAVNEIYVCDNFTRGL